MLINKEKTKKIAVYFYSMAVFVIFNSNQITKSSLALAAVPRIPLLLLLPSSTQQLSIYINPATAAARRTTPLRPPA